MPGRSIAENFIFVADLISACHSRKAPPMVIKLDFSKAFDSLSWDSLTFILRCRGFPPKFSSWVHDLLATGKTAVMLNGIPGNWINCKNGLRQGDPISPYLFIIVADLLQQMIQQDCDLAHLSHPLFSHLPPTVLQYADDTLIIAKASNGADQQLKNILHDFAMATGLTINFTKTTFVPMHVSIAMGDSIASPLQCPTSSFPQIYLGLPLTPTRLPTNAFLPIIERCRKFLTGWRAKILSKGDRLILLSAVLDSLLVYFMSVFTIHKIVLKTLDSIRRAFFWAAEETCTGAQCLGAWKNVCKPKNCGGLGLKNLHQQNKCLHMKFAVKALLPDTTPWLDWIALQHPNALIAPQNSHSFIGRTINQQLPALHAISFVLTNSGTNTYFWLDAWLHFQPLANLFPCLYSHTTIPLARVAAVLNHGLEQQPHERVV